MKFNFFNKIKSLIKFLSDCYKFYHLPFRDKLSRIKNRFFYSNDEEKEEFIGLLIFLLITGIFWTYVMFYLVP